MISTETQVKRWLSLRERSDTKILVDQRAFQAIYLKNLNLKFSNVKRISKLTLSSKFSPDQNPDSAPASSSHFYKEVHAPQLKNILSRFSGLGCHE